MNPIVAANIAVSLHVIEQFALWSAIVWNIGVQQLEMGASLILPDYQVRPPKR